MQNCQNTYLQWWIFELSFLAVFNCIFVYMFCIFRIQILDVYLAGGSIRLYRRRYQISQNRERARGSKIFLFYQKSRIKHFPLWSISYETEQQCTKLKKQIWKFKIVKILKVKKWKVKITNILWEGTTLHEVKITNLKI